MQADGRRRSVEAGHVGLPCCPCGMLLMCYPWRMTLGGESGGSPLPWLPLGSTREKPQQEMRAQKQSEGRVFIPFCSLPGITVSLHTAHHGSGGSSHPASLLAWRGKGSPRLVPQVHSIVLHGFPCPPHLCKYFIHCTPLYDPD